MVGQHDLSEGSLVVELTSHLWESSRRRRPACGPGEPCTSLGCSLSFLSLLVTLLPTGWCAAQLSSQHPKNSQTRQTSSQIFTRGTRASGRPSSSSGNPAGRSLLSPTFSRCRAGASSLLFPLPWAPVGSSGPCCEHWPPEPAGLGQPLRPL